MTISSSRPWVRFWLRRSPPERARVARSARLRCARRLRGGWGLGPERFNCGQGLTSPTPLGGKDSPHRRHMSRLSCMAFGQHGCSRAWRSGRSPRSCTGTDLSTHPGVARMLVNIRTPSRSLRSRGRFATYCVQGTWSERELRASALGSNRVATKSASRCVIGRAPPEGPAEA